MLQVCTLNDQLCRAISKGQCDKLTFEDLKNPRRLPALFTCWRQISGGEEWRKAVAKLLPSQEEFQKLRTGADGKPKRTYMQGLAQLEFYQTWNNLMKDEQRSKADRKAILEFARKRLEEEAGWLPVGASDWLWAGSGGGKAKILGTPKNKNKGTVIVINPALNPNTDIPGGLA
ncbi:hypothetical protein FRC12_009065 [Ceratobasidium sp. 428]|nr:hypothetical protein FRC12_009065 [Ceratobasidium sp. 428]